MRSPRCRLRDRSHGRSRLRDHILLRDIAAAGPELLDLAKANRLRDDAALRAPGCQVTTLRIQNLHRVVYIEAVQIGLQAWVTQTTLTSPRG
jgi:hypothetical protein